MHRNERTIQDVLGAIQTRQSSHRLSTTWRDEVMTEIARSGRFDAETSEWERLAPRFTLAATGLSILLTITASWSLSALSDTLYSTYAQIMYSALPTAMMGL